MPIPTLVVDDTITYRKIVTGALAAFPDFSVVGTAANGVLALRKMAQTPVRLVFLDVHMPEMGGVETLQRIKQEFPGTQVVMISGSGTDSAQTTIQALELGAVDFIRKPETASPEESVLQLQRDLARVLNLVQTRLLTQDLVRPRSPAGGTAGSAAPSAAMPAPPPPAKTALPAHFSLVVIGVSTGGPEALARIIPALPAGLPVPVLVVQHMPPVFTKSLAESLAKKSQVPVMEAADGEPVRAGTVYIAPGGRHLTVRMKDGVPVAGLNDEPPENSCRPSADVLFRSAAACGLPGVLAVVLTGMGGDGLNGVRALKRQACWCLTQSAATCVVYGMPRAVDEAGLSDRSLPLDEMAAEIARLVKR